VVQKLVLFYPLFATILLQLACGVPSFLPFGGKPTSHPEINEPDAAFSTLSLSLAMETPNGEPGQPIPAPTMPVQDFSCVMGSWEVDPESLLNAANLIMRLETSTILSVSPTIYFRFNNESNPERPPSLTMPYHMDVWYANVVINSMHRLKTGSGEYHQLDMKLDGMLSADMAIERGQIDYVPIPEETQFRVSDIKLDGTALLEGEGSTDISDFANFRTNSDEFVKTLVYECLNSNHLALAAGDDPLARILLTRTSTITP
jgi:hypothetical protein